MGKKRAVALGSEDEEKLKAKHQIQAEQKRLREGKTAKAPGLGGGQRVVDTTAETLVEYEKVQEKLSEITHTEAPTPTDTKTKKKVASRSRSSAYKQAKSHIKSDNVYPLSEGLTLLRQVSIGKFDSTVELHIVLKKAPENKLAVLLPHAFGKTKKVAIATDEVIKQIEANQINFDLLVASPAQMAKLVKFAKILGPKGLMPNPKSGTVSPNPEEAAKKLSSDTSTSLKLDKSGPVIHTSIGKLSFSDKQLQENIAAILQVVGSNSSKVVLKSTMSPAIKIAA